MSSRKYAIVGLGYIAPRHIDAIKRTGGEVVISCDSDSAKKIDGIPFYTNHEFMTADPKWKEVDTVVICTPNDTHVPITTWAARNGKRVICEKPFSISERDVQRVAGIRDAFVVMQLRHHPEFSRLVSNGKPKDCSLYVKVKRGNWYWEGWKGDKARSGGILFNIGVHYFDVLASIYGTDVIGVTKDVFMPNKVVGSIRFVGAENPVKFHVEVSDTDEGQDRYVEADGEKYRFSSQESLAMEDLHVKVYEEANDGLGIRPADVDGLTKLIAKLNSNA